MKAVSIKVSRWMRLEYRIHPRGRCRGWNIIGGQDVEIAAVGLGLSIDTAVMGQVITAMGEGGVGQGPGLKTNIGGLVTNIEGLGTTIRGLETMGLP